jgi:O-antigen/teichoic acid export membrane protein
MSQNPATAPTSPASESSVEHVRAREIGTALRNALKMGGSLIVTWSVALLVKLRVPAHLGPVRQGHFGFSEAFATMFFATLGLGIDIYLIKEVAVRPKHASDVVGGVTAFRSLLSVVLFAAMWGVLWATGRPREVAAAVSVFGITNFLMMLNATLGAVLQANSRVGAAAISNIATKFVWGMGLLLALHFDTPSRPVPLAVLALPALLGESLRTAILVPAARRDAGLRYRIDARAVRVALIESVPFFINALALGVLGNMGISALEFVRVDEREVGWFAADQNVAYLCMLLSPLLAWVAMPLLSRAFARSEEEGMAVFRRCLEALVITIMPITVLISAGSAELIHFAFGDKFAQARTGLSILSLVFALTYTNMMCGLTLIVMRRGWSVTTISIGGVFVTAILMFVFVPLGRRILGEGGECAGAASAIIGTEACVLVAMFSRFRGFPLDSRSVGALLKSAGVAVAILLLDRQLRFLGAARLVVDAVLYVGIALAIRVVRIDDARRVIELLRHKGIPAVAPAPSGEE